MPRSNDFILSIDAGTTGITVLIIDHEGDIRHREYAEIPQYYPQPGWVEHNAEEIWTVTRQLMTSVFKRYSPDHCRGIGITNQRETTVIWERESGHPVHHAIVWQCRRTHHLCESLKAQGLEGLFREKTGLVLDSYFSGTKIRWLLDNVEGCLSRAQRGELAFGTIDTWLIHKLTGGKVHATDPTNASRTLMYDIHRQEWDPQLLDILGIPQSLLPEVRKSSGHFGETDPELFGRSIPITGVAGDQQAALFGQLGTEPGNIKTTYGTGCFLLANTGKNAVQSTAGLLTTIACDSEGNPVYALEGSVFIGGAVIQWLRDELTLLDHARESEAAARSVDDTEGVVLVPAFTGLGAPYWRSDVRGAIFGLTRGTNRNHLIRAALESIAFQVADLVNAIGKDLPSSIDEMRVDGGAVKNDFLMQFQADILNIPVNRPKNIETTALGAGYLAGLGLGFWSSFDELAACRKTDRVFTPHLSPDLRQAELRKWKDAVEKLTS